MTDMSANVRLRPARIALLVHPKDGASVTSFMNLNCCLWGGTYNPIIPVFQTAPREWRTRPVSRVRGFRVARGYIEFFEPDIFVEAEAGLADRAGLAALMPESSLDQTVIGLNELLKRSAYRDEAEPSVGLSMLEPMRAIYLEEKRFQHRDKRSAIAITAGNAGDDAIFGTFPNDGSLRYFEHAYFDVFQPEVVQGCPDTWRRVFLDGADTPLRATSHGLTIHRSSLNDLVIFVFDPTKTLDLIDLWNLRLQPNPVLPVPIAWLDNLAPDIAEILRRETRPLQGNPNGVLHHPTIEFARCVPNEQLSTLLHEVTRSLGELQPSIKGWRSEVWSIHRKRGAAYRRAEVLADERHVTLQVKNGQTQFPALHPAFAERGIGGSPRWVNTLKAGTFENDMDVANVIPFNNFDRRWPVFERMGHPNLIGSEGWVFWQSYKDSVQRLDVPDQQSVVIGTLRNRGIDAKLSDAGLVAKQVIAQLRGLRGLRLLADEGTLILLNDMAGGLRKRPQAGAITEEHFGGRSRLWQEWMAHISKRNSIRKLHPIKVEEFTKRNIIRLGIQTGCPHCQFSNWHSLTAADYELLCERCLKNYPFPQASLENKNANWAFRAIGPFSVPDFARGAYGALLAVRLFETTSMTSALTFSPALSMQFNGLVREADYVALQAEDTIEANFDPRLIIGEAKSLGQGELIKKQDVDRLKDIARQLPGACLVVSVLRKAFTQAEKILLAQLAQWGRRSHIDARPINPVIVLTGMELLSSSRIPVTWKALGGEHAKHSEHRYTVSAVRVAPFARWREGRCSEPLRASTHDDFRAYA